MINEVKEEKPVEVTLPEETATEVELSDSKAAIKEEQPVVKVKEEQPEQPTVDEREKALQDLKKQYEHQKRVAEAEREARKQAELYAQQQAQRVGYAQIGRAHV